MSTLHVPVDSKRCVVIGVSPNHGHHMRGIPSGFSVTSVLSEQTSR
jgi:hypothetical protein